MAGKKLFLSSILITAILSVVASATSVTPAFAVTSPDFPSCANPQGTVKVSYDSGTHGVPGDGATYTGRDVVYSLSDNSLTQCLCTDQGQGIQTNWWKVSSISSDQVSILKSQGWILVPDGAAWGLDNGPYLAQNSPFTCPAQSGGAGGGQMLGGAATGAAGDGLSDGRSDGLSDGRSDGLGGGQVLGVSTGVLGLASTGNIVFILSVLLSGIAALSVGILLSHKKNK